MENEKSLKINQDTMDVLVANVIPTTKYFESRFDHMQYQIDEVKNHLDSFEKNVDKRFENVDKRFDDMKVYVDKRFENVDKRFDQVDKRFEQVDKSINNLNLEIQKLSKTMEVTLRDYIIERDRHYDKKFANLRNFNIAIISLVAGIVLKLMGIINIG